MENLLLRNLYRTKLCSVTTKNADQVDLDDTVFCYFSGPKSWCLATLSGENINGNLPEHIQAVNTTYLNIWKVIFVATNSSLIAIDTATSVVVCTPLNSEAKIVHTSWNPTQTFLVVVDEEGLLFGYSFKYVPNGNLSDEDVYQFIPICTGSIEENVPNSVYVGWGAHNTQFKGIKKQEEVIREMLLEYQPPKISWRGNGEMFVINFWKDYRRFLKVFNSNLRPLYVSEPYNNLLAPTSFKGQGNFIACAATDGVTNRIVIFEKNCLVKSSFHIPESKGVVKSVQYHFEKPILAVHSKTPDADYLNIYFYANGTWYLKQQLFYPLDETKVSLFKFHWISDMNASVCKLNVMTNRVINTYEFTVEHYGISHDLVAVINGSKVFFTEFSQEIIPPPMASKSLEFQRPVNAISYYNSESVYGFKLSDGTSVYYRYDTGHFEKCDDYLPSEETCNNVTSFKKIVNGEQYKICLNTNEELIINEKVVFSNVFSVHVHKNYLLCTFVGSGSYKLGSVRITPETMTNLNPEIFFVRELEQGAKIVCVSNKNEVILGLPRGNLETITCRLIAIDEIEDLLSQDDWESAIKLIRRQKLNWNLLIDLNLKRFMTHVENFIEAANSISLLNNIVSEFVIENCLETMYKFWHRQATPMQQYMLQKNASVISKIDILGDILKALTHLNPLLNLLGIVTLQIKHYSIKAALKSVLHAFQAKQVDICKKAVTQILRYKHAKYVISAAYSLYKVDFLNFIYSVCSEDPRIYEPEIEQLKSLNPLDLRFTMNLRGKNFETATKYLIRLETKDVPFITDFIKKNRTEEVAYKSIRPGHRHFKLISKLYAVHLALKTKHSEAGLILERAGLHEDALVYYKIARNWRKVLAILNGRNVLQGDAGNQVLRALAKDLVNHRQVDEGALIYEHYCDDYKAAIEAYVEHNMFQKAMCLSVKYSSKEVVDIVIQPALKKYREDLNDRITELGNKFSEYTSRLLELRQKKCEKLLRRLTVDDSGELGLDEMEFADTNSEYGSIISRSSAGSYSSGGSKSSSMSFRNRRKQERKKTDLKEGGTFEDIALIRQLYILALHIFSATEEIQEISNTLIDEENIKYVEVLRCNLDKVQLKIALNIPRIWTDTFLNAENSNKPTVLAVIENRHELDEQFRRPPPFKMNENINNLY